MNISKTESIGRKSGSMKLKPNNKEGLTRKNEGGLIHHHSIHLDQVDNQENTDGPFGGESSELKVEEQVT